MFLHRFSKVKAPEFPARLTWLNGEALRMKNLVGKVVLIDFWTFSCVNCVRMMPFLAALHEAYEKKGLVVIGVHTPEFAFEKEEKNVIQALKQYGITYPVVLDPDYKIWKQYMNRWWPRQFLIDSKGYIVYDHVGEGGQAETEHAIQKALKEIGVADLPAIAPDPSMAGGICYRTTPEAYLGFLRGRFGNSERVQPNREQVFTDAGEHEDDLTYLHGHFSISSEYVEHTRTTAVANEYVAIKYSAFSLNVVLEKTGLRTATIEIELDGQPLPKDMAGEDITFVKGKSILKLTKSRLYRVVNADTYHRGLIKFRTKESGVRFYAFTFGSCKGM